LRVIASFGEETNFMEGENCEDVSKLRVTVSFGEEMNFEEGDN
jgi:hypothetical protein